MNNKREIEILTNLLSEKRLSKLQTVLKNRIDTITIVLEDLHDPHNISAIIRTAEGLGIQDIHIVENKHKFEVSKNISKYSHKWITTHKHNCTTECINGLKQKGFEICVSALAENSATLNEIEITETSKTAFVLGSEHDGVSQEMKQLADKIFVIPMAGFTQSFNVSVAAAIILYSAIEKKRSTLNKNGTLNKERLNNLYLQWLKKSVKNSDKILKASIEKL
jgi:tRNA (guanosine-2'-O-)-methyltransferase